VRTSNNNSCGSLTEWWIRVFYPIMSRDLDRQLLARLDEMTPALIRSLRILDPRGPVGLDITLNQFIVLSLLARKDSFVMGELARQMGTSSGNMTAMIDRMVRSGLVIRERSEKDRRVVEVKLSQKGKDIADNARRGTQAGMRRIMKKIPDDQKKAFFDTLSAVVDALAEDRQRRGPIKIRRRSGRKNKKPPKQK
jgi:DNA-binding MarR family transcriptional regulator